ncbi:MAG: DNA repair protein RecO [Phycisphaerales bacterium]|nr:DNA repair protein RecO [Phycisphaerales bacterium]
MPTIVDDAVCVRHWDFSETSQTVSLFCREHGLLRGLAKGAKRERGRFSGGIDLLTRGQVVALVKSGRELATLTDWDLQQTFRWLRERLDANRAAFHMAELVLRLITDADPHPNVFDGLVAALESLATPGAEMATVLRFEWLVLGDTGYRPRLAVPPESGATLVFSPVEGGIVDDPSAPGWRVRVETVRLLERVAEGGSVDDAPREAVTRAARLLAAYLRELIGEEPATMRAFFGPVAPVRAGGSE